MISSTITVTTTAQKIISKSNSYRTIYLHVVGNGTVYVGGSTVTAVNGLATEKHTAPLTFEIPAQEELWVVVATGTEDLRMLIPEGYTDAA